MSLLFSSTGLFYLFLIPLLALQLFGLLAVAALVRPGIRIADTGKAIFSYSCQTLGILLMSIGGIPTLYSVLASQPLSSPTYTALLFLFAVGGITFLWHDDHLNRMDAAGRAIPRMIFGCAWKFIGFLIVLLSLLSFMLRLTLQGTSLPEGWWVMHLALLLYGVILSFSSMSAPAASGFRSHSMATSAAVKRKKK